MPEPLLSLLATWYSPSFHLHNVIHALLVCVMSNTVRCLNVRRRFTGPLPAGGAMRQLSRLRASDNLFTGEDMRSWERMNCSVNLLGEQRIVWCPSV